MALTNAILSMPLIGLRHKTQWKEANPRVGWFWVPNTFLKAVPKFQTHISGSKIKKAISQEDAIYMVPRPLQNLGGDSPYYVYTALLGFQSRRLPRILSFTFLLWRPPFWVFNLPFHILFCIFLLFFFFLVLHRNVERGLQAPSCKVPHVSIKISRHIEIMSIYVSSDYASSEEGLLHHIRALVGRGKFSSMIRHGLVMLFQDWATFFKDSESKLLVKLLLDTSLVQLSMAHCGHAFLTYHVQLLISRTGPLSFWFLCL